MKENKTMDRIHRDLLKKFHTLCSLAGLSEDMKRAIIESYGVESSRDIDTHDLVDICAKLSTQLNERQGTVRLDKLRKQLLASIGSWLRSTGQEENIRKIKAIACRATGYDDFNKIPRERLRNLIATFNNKVKDAQAVNALIKSLAKNYPSLN